MSEKIKWEHYGDKNPIEHGGVFVQRESETTFRIVKIQFVDDMEKNMLHDLYVDISDDWIEEESVNSFAGISEDDDNVHYAIACTDYYSHPNFGCHESIFLTLEESANYLLEHYGIEVE